ncbi:hypothetical protein BCY91_16965 [Pelobium manganitolerans]|uniref:YARHG domain-containing protein n=1 Tax=Pelobium manganitolerans TaxID=1842495 RepID=A0A419S7S0_9SPHI|nr:hypothetical protein [Pelobium manganitolerans]RKD17505.1 hypothetical protein BCY91_16965 [Pelobium manganitolerans]
MKKSLFFLFLIIQTVPLFAQNKLGVFEDSLQNLGHTILTDTLQEKRVEANYQFIKTLVDALKEKNSFYYPFNKLRDIVSVQKTEDNKFRIFTWFNQYADGTYRYFGAIQVNNPQKLELYPLLDNTQEISALSDVNSATLAPNKWLGAVYYQIIPVTGIREPYFILLGWKGKSATANSKIIETLKFVDGKPVFGADVLEASLKANQFQSRMVFDYAKTAAMMLRYVRAENMIVFDHLVPIDKRLDGVGEFYAPDLSYDGLKLKQGKWYFQENMQLSNLPDENDELFIDPAKDSQNTAPVINN